LSISQDLESNSKKSLRESKIPGLKINLSRRHYLCVGNRYLEVEVGDGIDRGLRSPCLLLSEMKNDLIW